MRRNNCIQPHVIRIYNDGSIERPLNVLTTPVNASQAFVNGVATRDLEINPHTGIWARIYLPETSKEWSQVEKHPILLHFHGGGFCTGSADERSLNLFLYRLVKQCRVMCVSVNYRLAPEHRLPAACEDGIESLEWLYRLARGDWEDPWLSTFGDFTQCFLLGDSAGGNLVHEVAIRAAPIERLHPLRLCGGIMIHPGFVREQRSKSEMETPPNLAMLSTEMVDKMFSLTVPEGSTKDHPVSNSTGPLAPNLQHMNLPPFLVVVADHDLLRDTQFEYCEDMKIAGKSVEVFKCKNVGHCFHLNTIDDNISQQTQDLLDVIQNFIKICCQEGFQIALTTKACSSVMLFRALAEFSSFLSVLFQIALTTKACSSVMLFRALAEFSSFLSVLFHVAIVSVRYE